MVGDWCLYLAGPVIVRLLFFRWVWISPAEPHGNSRSAKTLLIPRTKPPNKQAPTRPLETPIQGGTMLTNQFAMMAIPFGEGFTKYLTPTSPPEKLKCKDYFDYQSNSWGHPRKSNRVQWKQPIRGSLRGIRAKPYILQQSLNNAW